ncbi:YbaB/EbfC family nucleoid-associated protein [Cryptosporangium sp. NPDC051539]|uniref:YbaB/EbfC family nucleoid-associated protein n=1 Tax=Cryptosporangium sp. NPDC051539 TaxID=3363962 RepID=UPI00379230D5
MQPGGQFDMQAILAQAQQMQQHIMDAQAQLAEAEFTGAAGGGLVTATVSGTGELVGLVIQPAAADPDDTETLADLVVAAVRTANAEAQKAAADTMGPLAGGLPGLPGLGM